MNSNKKLDITFKMLIGALFLNIVLFFNTCGNNTDEIVEAQSRRIDSLERVVEKRSLSGEEVELITKYRYRIEALRTSKNILRDWNQVVRRAVRPDERLREYDQRIQDLNQKFTEKKDSILK